MPTAFPDKKTVANQLKLLANYLILEGEEMRAKAYERAARAIENFTGDLATLHAQGDLASLRGIGKGIASDIAQLAEQSVLPSLEESAARIPAGVRDLFKVNGLGAKKIKQLWEAEISSLEQLIASAESGSLEQLKGFGKKSCATILTNARFALTTLSSLRLDEAEKLATELLIVLKRHAPSAQIYRAGDMQRFSETVACSELLAVHDEPQAWLQQVQAQVLTEWQIETSQLEGDTLSFVLERHPVHIHACRAEHLIPRLVASSSSAEHWQFLQEHAAAHHYSLTPTALSDAEGASIPLEDEKQLYQQLALPFCPAECREKASADGVDELISLEQIRGVVHNHSNWSDGAHSLEEMAGAARAQGFAYLAMADHSRSAAIANGLSIERVQAQGETIVKLNEALKADDSDFTILHGIEVDILKDGTLDYPDELLAALDYCVVSVHQHFTLSQAAQTERIIKAVSHPYADILAHGTGRILLRRPSYALDIPAVIEACAHYGTVIELNASPYRLDLSWQWLELALEQGCHIAINPDAHSISGYKVLRYGVMMARKAGVPAERVINTAANASEFLGRLKRDKIIN